jgi:hypothetical protein
MLRARGHGVRYCVEGQERLAGAGIEHGGWIPNFALPGVFARFPFTRHIELLGIVTELNRSRRRLAVTHAG